MLARKLPSPLKNKQAACQMLRVNLQNAANIVANIIRANQSKHFFLVLHHYVARLGLFPNEKLRDVLYNIEQFKFDAARQPELTARSPPSSAAEAAKAKAKAGTQQGSSMAKRLIKDSDKSSGTNNLVGAGQG